ncbi:hypothetical protein [uncultured Flavobacterium sp.]|uniref:hypothetical protein n=1 Tax=uncultured Flavobacterium sp. TaxID=165435 RepID=UPI0030EECBDE
MTCSTLWEQNSILHYPLTRVFTAYPSDWGLLHNKPLFSEDNENRGIIEIKSGEEKWGIMIVQNCNPENQSIANPTFSKNKHFVTTTYSHFGKPSMEKTKSVEWYRICFPENATEESRKVAIKTLVCLFFGIGSM